VGGCGASAGKSPCSAADASPVTLVSDGKPLQIRHLCFVASRSSVRQGVFSGPKSPDAPEPHKSTAAHQKRATTCTSAPRHHSAGRVRVENTSAGMDTSDAPLSIKINRDIGVYDDGLRQTYRPSFLRATDSACAVPNARSDVCKTIFCIAPVTIHTRICSMKDAQVLQLRRRQECDVR
jgi:hypothetical protein